MNQKRLLNWRWETHRADSEFFTPMVVYGDTSEDWSTLGANYHKRLESLLANHGKLPEYIASWNIDYGGEQAVGQIAAGVQNLLSYRALPFGDRGIIPEPTDSVSIPAGETAKSTVYSYVRELPISDRAVLALVDIDDRIEVDFPSMAQFDHMIVYVPESDGPGYWLDATNKDATFDRKPPYGLAGRKALLLDGEQSRL